MPTENVPLTPPVVTAPREPFYERNAVALQWAIIAVAFVIAVGIYWWRSSFAVEATAMGMFTMANSAEDYAEVAANFENSKAASWSQLREVNGYLDSALQDAFRNREKANTDLKKASDLLETLRKANGSKEFKEQVQFAFARSLEMSSDGKLEPAIEAYEQLLKDFPNGHFQREAEERIHALKRPEAQEFYAFFSKQNPKPADPATPKDELKTQKQDGKEDLLKPLTGFGNGGAPAEGGSSIPSLRPPSLLDKSVAPDEGTAIPDVPKKKDDAKEAPKTEDKPAAETKPAETPAEKPAEKAEPKTEDKPAEAPKAEETKPAEPKADEPKQEEPKKEEPKKE